jgi:uncharacterized membrane protein (DUF2068 family)
LSRKKPSGIVLIAIYSGLSGVASLIGGIGLLLASALPGMSLWYTSGGLALEAYGAFVLASVYGLWSLQAWGRSATQWLYLISIPLGVIAIFPIFPGSEMSASNTLFQVVAIAISLLVLWYLSRSRIRDLYAPPGHA